MGEVESFMIISPDKTRWVLDLCKGHQSPIVALMTSGRMAGEPRKRAVFHKTDPKDLLRRAVEA